MSEKIDQPKNIEIRLQFENNGVTSEMVVIIQIPSKNKYSCCQSVRSKNNPKLELLLFKEQMEEYNQEVAKHCKSWNELVKPYIPFDVLPFVVRYTEANNFFKFPHGQVWFEVKETPETENSLIVLPE